jgi:hypothetical protein
MFQDSVRVLNPAMIARAKVEIDSAKADCDYLVALLPDGSVRTYYRDGTVVTQFPEGGIETRYPDGVTSRTHAQTIPSTPPPSAPPAADMAAWLGTIEAGLLDQIRALAGSEVDVNNYLASEPGVAPTVYARIQKRLDLVAHMTHAVLSGKGGRK